jgi:hypothetical protein
MRRIPPELEKLGVEGNWGTFKQNFDERNKLIERFEKAESENYERAVSILKEEIRECEGIMTRLVHLYIRAGWEFTDEMRAFTSNTKSDPVVEEAPSAVSKDIVFALLERVQDGGAVFTDTEEDILKKVKAAKTGDSLATYRSEFITKYFRPEYESVISVLEMQGKVTFEFALAEIGCNAWFGERVLNSIIANCKGRNKFAHRFKGHTVEKKKRRLDDSPDKVWHLVVLPKQ